MRVPEIFHSRKVKICLLLISGYALAYGGYHLAVTLLPLPNQVQSLVYRKAHAVGETLSTGDVRVSWTAVRNPEDALDLVRASDRASLVGKPLLKTVETGSPVRTSDFLSIDSEDGAGRQSLWIPHLAPGHHFSQGERLVLHRLDGTRISESALLLENNETGYLTSVRTQDVKSVIAALREGGIVASRRSGKVRETSAARSRINERRSWAHWGEDGQSNLAE